MSSAPLLQALQDLQSYRYMNLAMTTMWAYDALLGIAQEIRIFSSRPLRFLDVIYMFSRLLALCHVCIGAISIFIPIDSCLTGPFSIAVTWIVSLSTPVNSWIFFVRVRAAYYESRVIVGLFAVLWACTLLYIGTPFAYVVTLIPLGAGRCAMSTELNHTLEAASFLLVAIFDTAVMIAISTRVMSYSPSKTWKSKLYSLVFGNEMGDTSRMFLRSTQIYYFSTFGSQIAMALMIVSSAVPVSKVGMVALFQLFIQNIMVSRVYRMTRLHSDSTPSSISIHLTSIRFSNNISTSHEVSSSVTYTVSEDLPRPSAGPHVSSISTIHPDEVGEAQMDNSPSREREPCHY